jgi:ankyrin repeat protein
MGMTPLLKAASLGRIHMVKDLLKAGADRNVKDLEGKTPKERAEFYEEFEVYDLLTENE